MFVQYGSVNLRVVEMDECIREVVSDPSGIDYLWTKWRLSFTATYSPDQPYTVSVGPGDPLNGASQVNPIDAGSGGYSAITTDVALRHRLSQHRQPLYVWEYSGIAGAPEIWLWSATSTPCDVNNGPIVVDVSVEEVRGASRMFLVRFVVETYINECGWGGRLTPYLLSNRWTTSISADEEYNETRTFAGMAVFRADMLRRDHALADSERFNLLPPVPANCKRYIDQLELSPGGNMLTYQVRDVEQPVTYIDQPTDLNGRPITSRNRRNVTRINARARKTYQQQGANAVSTALINELRTSLWTVGQLSHLFTSAEGGPLGEAALAVGTAGGANISLASLEMGAALASAGVNTANQTLPTFVEECTVEVFGNRLAKMGDLQYLAFAVAFSQLSNQRLRNDWLQGVQSVTSNLIGGAAVPLLGGLTAASTASSTQITQNAAAGMNTVQNLIARVMPPAQLISLEYDLFTKRVLVTVQAEYSGLIDWCSGRTSAGLRTLTDRLKDEVRGADWPDALRPVPFLGVIGSPVLSPLPDLPDKRNLIGTNLIGAQLGPPADDKGRTTSFLDLIAAELTSPCKKPPTPLTDATLTATPNPPPMVPPLPPTPQGTQPPTSPGG